jgi:L-asparaginase
VNDANPPGPHAGPLMVLATGGTIDKVYNLAGELEIGPPAAQHMLDTTQVALTVDVQSVIAKDSLDITDTDRELLVARITGSDATRVVITHGTDTMTTTAEYLQRSLPAGKTVVLTGALQPAAMRETDAHFNFGSALLAAQACPTGVYVCMNGRVLEAGGVVKDPRTGRFVTVTA